MGNDFCKHDVKDTKEISSYSFRSGMILERVEENVFDDYEYIGSLGCSLISTVSSIQRRDISRQSNRNICFGLINISKLFPKKDIMDNVDDSISCKSRRKQIFALKTIDLRCICQEYMDELRNEIEILRSLDHPNIVKAYETYEYRSKLFLIMELCSGGDLHSRVPYTEKESCQLIRKILLAVGYMHRSGIVHRDLKFENIMFESNKLDAEIKIIDFGLSKKFVPKDDIFTRTVGTLYTMAPEVMTGRYSTKVDLWSIGVIAYILLSTQKPFLGTTRRKMVKNIMKCNYNFNHHQWANISKEAKHFVSKLLKLEPEDRSTIGEALESNWLRKNEPKRKSITKEISDCFMNFSQNSEVKKLALAIIAHKSTADDIFNLRQIFGAFDTTKSGRITYEEFREALSSHHYSDDDLRVMFSNADTFGYGHISYTEFLAATMETQGQIAEDKLKEVFRYFDRDESGFISKDNLKSLLSKTYTEEFIDQVISETDIDNDGQISFEEFFTAFHESEIIAIRQFSLDNCK